MSNQEKDIFSFEDFTEELASDVLTERSPVLGESEKGDKIRELSDKIMSMLTLPATYADIQNFDVNEVVNARKKVSESVKNGEIEFGGKDWEGGSNPRRKNPYVGADEESFTKVVAPSLAQRMSKEAVSFPSGHRLVEKDIDEDKLQSYSHIRNFTSSPISIAIGEVSMIKAEDLIPSENEEGIFIIETSKLMKREASSCITFGEVNTPDSFVTLNVDLRIRLCASAEFREFVRLGCLGSATEKEKDEALAAYQKAKEEERKLQENYEKENGILIGVEDVLPFAEKEVERMNCMEIYQKHVDDLAAMKGTDASPSEKLRIASDIIRTALEVKAKELEEKSKGGLVAL